MNTPNNALLARTLSVWSVLSQGLDLLKPVVLLLSRLYVAKVFFSSGLTKLNDWGTTVALFSDEYKVPLLPPALAAFMGTAGELILPILLALGFGGRFAALGLSVINVVAVISLGEIAPAALAYHYVWGVILAYLAVFGPGSFSLDQYVWPKLYQPS